VLCSLPLARGLFIVSFRSFFRNTLAQARSLPCTPSSGFSALFLCQRLPYVPFFFSFLAAGAQALSNSIPLPRDPERRSFEFLPCFLFGSSFRMFLFFLSLDLPGKTRSFHCAPLSGPFLSVKEIVLSSSSSSFPFLPFVVPFFLPFPLISLS